METLLNELMPNINFNNIDKDYSIVKFETSEKYIKYGAAILDNEEIKALSIAFEKGNSFYALFNKGEEEGIRFLNLGDNISFNNIRSFQVPTHLLIRLFLNSLNNFKTVLAFNNLGGNFYTIFEISKNEKNIKVLRINVSEDLLIDAAATNFMKIDKAVNDKPMYVFSFKNNSFKRIFDFDKNFPTYINKNFGKTEIEYLNLANKNSKVKVLFSIINEFNRRYSSYISLSFKTANIVEKKDSMEKEFMDTTIKKYNEISCYIMNFSNTQEDEYSFDKLKSCIESYTNCNVRKVNKVNNNGINLIYIHNAEYYENKKILDPYKGLNLPYPIQRFTVENFKDFIDGNNKPKAALKTILKESVIKHDVFVNQEISFDDWKKYNFKNDWIFGISKEVKSVDKVDSEFYFIRIHPNGKFQCYKFINDLFNQDEYSLYRKLLVGSNTNKVLVQDDLGNINVIEQTNYITLPSLNVFEEKVGRGKDDRQKYYSGIVDINYYVINNESYYNVGPLGNGMQSSIPKASHLYKINVINNSKNIVKDLLDLMGVSFVKFNSFTVLPYPIKYLKEFAKIDY